MFGQLAFGLWVAAVTLAGIYFGQSVAASPHSAEIAAAGGHGGHGGHGAASPDFHTDLFAIPHVDKTGIAGYLTGRFTIETDPAQAATLRIPLNTLVFDSLSRHFYAEAGAFATSKGWENLTETLDGLRDQLNETAGRPLVTEVLIEQLDYFSKEDIRMGEEQSFTPVQAEEKAQ